MKTKQTGIAKSAAGSLTKVVERLLPEIRLMIEEARHRAVTVANLSMVTLYWNIGRVITTEIQKTPGRADYGEGSLARLGERLNHEYDRGFSERNLRDMRRFFDVFQIRQPVAAESAREVLSVAVPTTAPMIRQPVAAESGARLEIDLTLHFHLGWTHYLQPNELQDLADVLSQVMDLQAKHGIKIRFNLAVEATSDADLKPEATTELRKKLDEISTAFH